MVFPHTDEPLMRMRSNQMRDRRSISERRCTPDRPGSMSSFCPDGRAAEKSLVLIGVVGVAGGQRRIKNINQAKTVENRMEDRLAAALSQWTGPCRWCKIARAGRTQPARSAHLSASSCRPVGSMAGSGSGGSFKDPARPAFRVDVDLPWIELVINNK